jgi:replicative DNA helicase
MAGMTINKLCSKARRIVQEKGVQLILIDYMQLIQSEANKHVTRQEMIAEISRQLKLLAKDLKIPVIVLSQLNRNIESREGVDGKRPHLSDLRDSGSIEQDADLVMFIHRPEYYGYTVDKSGNDLRGIAQIIIAKHRKGALGQVDLKFTPQYSQFEDQA